MMKISHFYEDVLGANLANARWSWGAVDPVANRVYLRVWEDEIDESSDGERVLVLKKVPKAVLEAPGSNGYPERQRHLETIRKGAEGYGVVCVARFTPDDDRKIAAFDAKTVLVFGDIVNVRGNEFAIISSRIPVSELKRQQTGHSTLSEDLKAILRRSQIESTTKEALVAARIGQGLFRTTVLSLWESRCAVTGSNTLDAVRASHIKPWRNSSDAERLDPMNGLPLVATLDALFDAGLISFDDAGKMLVSGRLPKQERKVLGVGNGGLRNTPPVAMRHYLAAHRESVYVG